MATRNFTNFDLSTDQTLNSNDFIVGYKADGTAELRTTVRNLNYTPYVEVILGGDTLQQRINDTEYIFEWNTKNFETNSSILFGNQNNYNIVINQTGFYEVEARYAGYDLEGADYMLMRLRGSTSPIITFTNNLLELLDTRSPGITVPLNGTATIFGRTIVRVSTVPYYLAITYQAGGGSADSGIGYYTVAETTFGNVPRLRVRKINAL